MTARWGLTAIVLALSAALAQADSKLTGSDLKSEDLILKADAIIVAKLVKVGIKTSSGSQLVMHENQAEEIQFLRGGTQSPLEIDIPLDLAKGENTPALGVPYIFFLAKNHTRPAAWAMDPYDAIKLLSATDANVAEVKRLINLPVNYHQLSGSTMNVGDAVQKSNCIFVGTVARIGSADLGPIGVLDYFGVSVGISRLFLGPATNPLSIDLHVIYNPHEDAPKAGQSYLFFVARDPAYNETTKILPATDENIAQVAHLLSAAPAQNNNSTICDDLSAHDALVTADAVFEGHIEEPGTPDRTDLYSFVFPAPHLCGVKIKTSHIFRGTVAASTKATIFVNKSSSELAGSYIFYARNGSPGDKDPFTILKAIPATDANRQQVADSITPPADSVLCGSTLTPEHAAEIADVILVGEVTKSVIPTLFSIKVFKVDRGLVANGNIWINQEAEIEKKEALANEGGSYVFFLGKTDPYNTNHFNVLKALSATQENIALAKKLALQFAGPKGPGDSFDGKIRIHIAPDANND